LIRARQRGVEVRVLIDGYGGGYFTSSAYRQLRRAGVPAARFLHSPLPWRMPFLNLRSHKKILGIDGRIAFTGGLNIGAENLTARSLAAYRGVEVDLVLPEHSNHPTVDWGSRVQMAPLLAAGCRVWNYPAPFNHSKLMSVDGVWALIGSANWDVRSFRLNFE